MNTDFRGRVANTSLGLKHGLLPLFEAIVNSIDAIEQRDSGDGRIVVTVVRDEDEPTEDLHGNVKRSITDFYVQDNGIGFTEANFASFQTLDTRSKEAQGGKGVGRLLWLKAFSSAAIQSRYVESEGPAYLRSFRFLMSDDGVVDVEIQEIGDKPSTVEPETTVHLKGFRDRYREAVPKGGYVIARRIVEHFLEYFVLDRAPQIDFEDFDDDYFANLNDIYQEEYLQEANQRSFAIQENEFLLLDTFLRADGDESLPTSVIRDLNANCTAFTASARDPCAPPLRSAYNVIRKTQIVSKRSGERDRTSSVNSKSWLRLNSPSTYYNAS